MTRTKPSRPIGAPGESSKVCVTDRPTDTTGYRSALTHQKIPEKEAFETDKMNDSLHDFVFISESSARANSTRIALDRNTLNPANP